MGKPEAEKIDEAKAKVLPPIAPRYAPGTQPRDPATLPKRSAKNPLTNLTRKQEAFVQYIMEGHSQAQAYRMAYDTRNMAPHSIYAESWKLYRHPDVALRIEQINGWMEEKQRMQAIGMAGFVQERLLHLAVADDTPKHVKIQALNSLGRSVGMFVDRRETKTISDDSLDELEAKLRAKMDALKLVNEHSKDE